MHNAATIFPVVKLAKVDSDTLSALALDHALRSLKRAQDVLQEFICSVD